MVKEQPSLLGAKHVGTFLVLIFISTFKPTSIWSDFTISLEPVAVLVLMLLLWYKITFSIGLKHFVSKYAIELTLVSSYFFICFLSLYFNSWRYQDNQELVRYGVTFIAITACFPASIVLFALPQQNSGFSLTNFITSKGMDTAWLPIIVMMLISMLGVIQVYIPDLYFFVHSFFIASEVDGLSITRSIFRISTDFASICAIVGCIMLMFGLITFGQLSKYNRILIFSCAFICLTAGILTGKRVYLLTLICTLSISFIYFYRLKWKVLLSLFFVSIIVSNLFIVFGPESLSTRMGEVLPYISYLNQFEWPPISSFSVELQQGGFQARIELWQSALKMFSENPVIGVTNGGYRLANQYLEQNTHNIFLQVLIDAGVIGAGLILVLISRFIFVAKDKMMTISAAILVISSLSVDFFIDHSVPWIIVVTYYFTWYWRITENFKSKDLDNET